LAPVKNKTSRSTSSKLCRGSQTNTLLSPLIVASIIVFLAMISPCPLDCQMQYPFRQNANQVFSLLGRASHVVNGRCRIHGEFGRLSDRLFVNRPVG
jgi:hypothetical protein